MSMLNGDKLEAAIGYNNARGLDPTTIKRLQQAVGTQVDGYLGPATAKAVFEWQGALGLVQDGKIGPKTLAEVTSEHRRELPPVTGSPCGPRIEPLGVGQGGRGSPCGPQIGVWVDDTPDVALSESYFDRLGSLGFSTLAIMLHHTTAGRDSDWQPRWSADQLERLRALAEPREISLVLTTWPLPSRELIGVFARELPSLLAAAGAVALEVDTESNWLSPRLDGYADMDEAARALVDTMRAVAAPSGAALQLTTYPFHPENGPQAKVAPHMDRVFPQAYSVGKRRKKPVGWDDREGPGHLQKFSAARAREIASVAQGRTKLGMGLAAYNQQFVGHTPVEALTLAYDSASSLGVAEVRYWSSKWIFGQMRDPVDQFMLTRANRARTGPAV